VLLIADDTGEWDVISNRKIYVVDLSGVESYQVTMGKFGSQCNRINCNIFRCKYKGNVFDMLDINGTCGACLLYFI
jgi:hypothetical protein